MILNLVLLILQLLIGIVILAISTIVMIKLGASLYDDFKQHKLHFKDCLPTILSFIIVFIIYKLTVGWR